MINRNESQLLAKERSNRLARAETASSGRPPAALKLPRQSANQPLAAPSKHRHR